MAQVSNEVEKIAKFYNKDILNIPLETYVIFKTYIEYLINISSLNCSSNNKEIEEDLLYKNKYAIDLILKDLNIHGMHITAYMLNNNKINDNVKLKLNHNWSLLFSQLKRDKILKAYKVIVTNITDNEVHITISFASPDHNSTIGFYDDSLEREKNNLNKYTVLSFTNRRNIIDPR